MSLDFEAIHAALFTLAQQQMTGVKTFSRVWRSWSEVSPADQPALFQVEEDYEITQDRGVPPRYTLHAHWILYVNGSALDQAPGTQLNTMLNAVFAAVPPKDFTQIQTLGGLVYRCWINGKVETDGGFLGQQRVAIVPIELLVV